MPPFNPVTAPKAVAPFVKTSLTPLAAFPNLPFNDDSGVDVGVGVEFNLLLAARLYNSDRPDDLTLEFELF
jgi:hypothetical protein